MIAFGPGPGFGFGPISAPVWLETARPAGPLSRLRGLLPDEIGAFGISVAMHAAVAASFLFSFHRDPPPVEHPATKVFNVSFVSGEGDAPSIPKTGAIAPRTSDRPQPSALADAKPAKVVEKESESAPSPGHVSAADRPVTGGAPDMGGLIWTPPAPVPNAADPALRATPAASPGRVVLPQVVLGKGASDPVLLSYQEGRWSDGVSVAESRLVPPSGRITMTASVDEKGIVSRCDVSVTSGSRAFDDRACGVVRSYVYRPAQDAAGHAHPALVIEVLEWSRDGASSLPVGADPFVRP